LNAAGITGLCDASDHERISVANDAKAVAQSVASALLRLQDSGVAGPYLLVLGATLFRTLATEVNGYPLRKQIAQLVGSASVYSPALRGGLLVSTRGGDFELHLGQDMSLGYENHDGSVARLFLTETFTFRAAGGEALVVLEPRGG
jgi:uncharacterized linocin/CFP29 family protein